MIALVSVQEETMVDRKKDLRLPEERPNLVDLGTRIIVSSPKSEPNLESSFIFPRADDDEPELEPAREEGCYPILFGAVPSYK
jgi:hypothetical protein